MFLDYPIGRRTLDSDHPVISDTFLLRIPLLSNVINTSSSNPIAEAIEFAMSGESLGEARDVLLEQDCNQSEGERGVQRNESSHQNVSEQNESGHQNVSEQNELGLRSVSEQDELSLSHRSVSEQDELSQRSVSEQDELDQRSVSEQDESDQQSVSEQDELDHQSVSEQDELDLEVELDAEGYISSDSGAGDINTPLGVPQTPAPDPHAFVEFDEFDYEVEMEDFENLREFDVNNPFDMNEFEQDLNTIGNMDFSQYLH